MAHAVRLVAALGLLFFLASAAGAADDLVAVPPLAARVTDLTGTLSDEQRASLEADLALFERSRGSQIAILLVPSTKPETIEAYSILVAEAWKLGRKGIDDGILILVAMNDRKLRIEVGRGLEGAVPDAVAKRIVAEVIGPRFKEGDFFGGLQAGVAKLQSVIGGEALPSPKGDRRSGVATLPTGLEGRYLVGMFIAVIVGSMLSKLYGRLAGSASTGGVFGFLVWLGTSLPMIALGAGLIVFILILFLTLPRSSGWSSGDGGGGAFSRGWSGGGSDEGFSGGGGDFGGGGASGDW